MTTDIVSRFVKVVVIDDTNALTIKRITNDDKSNINGNLIIELDLSGNANINSILQQPRASLFSLISLNLSQCNLNYIPDSFKDLRINELNLSYNSFKEVPFCIINGLKFLYRLDISHNRIEHFEEPLCVKKLRSLHLNNNKLINIPDWILKVHAFNLEELDYSFNELTTLARLKFDKVPTYELRKLILKNCCVRSTDILHLKNIKTLKVLDLSNSDEKKNFNCIMSCDELFNKPRWDDCLKILSLNFLGVSDLPDEISLLIALEELHLRKNQLLWLPDTIVSLDNLRLIDLTYNKIVCLPSNFCKMRNLEVLILAHNSLTTFTNPLPLRLVKLDLYNNLLECHDEFDFCDLKIDLELNYLETSRLNGTYEQSKNLLRADVDELRSDGQKKPKEDLKFESSSESDCDEIDEREYCDENREDALEEWWTSDVSADLGNDGCSLSDNEWTGREKPTIVKVRKNSRQRYPSWMFEDVPL